MKKHLFFILLALFFLVACNGYSDHTDQFKALTESLTKSGEIIKNNNDVIYTTLRQRLLDPQTAEQAKKWHLKAMQVKKLSDEMTAYIGQLKKALKKEDGSVQHLFIKMKKAEELSTKLANFPDSILAVLNPDEFNGNPILQSSIKKDNETFKKTFPIYNQAGITSNYFKNINTAGALAILQKIENEVAIMENYLLNYFKDNTAIHFCSYSAFSPLVTQSTSYCKAGETIDIYAGIGSFTMATLSTITINGNQVQMDADGVAKYTFKADEAPGKHIVPVTIRYIQPDGSDAIIFKKISYEVAKQH